MIDILKYPKKIDNIKLGLTSVSDGANNKVDIVTDYLSTKRIFYKLCDFVKNSKNLESANAESRAMTFLQMWCDKEINYVISTFGGEFCMSMLEHLYNNPNIKNNTKWFQGFSDASFINYFLTTNYNIPSVHFYNLEDYGSISNINKIIDLIQKIQLLEKKCEIMQESSTEHINTYTREIDDSAIKTEKTIVKSNFGNGSLNGVLIGGWIEALSTICGTKYDNTKNFCLQFPQGMLWYIDNCELTSPMFRRKIWQLKEAHYFDNCNGILIGRQPTDEFVGDYDYCKAVSDTFPDIPVISDLDIGHFFPQWFLINGSYANIKVENGKALIKQRLL